VRRHRVKSWLFALALAAMSALASHPAQAVIHDREEAPVLGPKKPWIQWGVGTALLVAVLIPVFKDPKRGHQ